MTIYDVTDEKFKKYGRIVQNIDFSELVDAINEKIVPLEGYKPLTNCTETEQMRKLKLGV